MTTEPARGQIDILFVHAHDDFGVGGQLGVESKRELTERGYQVHIFARTQIDITSQAAVEQCISNEDPRTRLQFRRLQQG